MAVCDCDSGDDGSPSVASQRGLKDTRQVRVTIRDVAHLTLEKRGRGMMERKRATVSEESEGKRER